jgi:hypothetical protein
VRDRPAGTVGIRPLAFHGYDPAADLPGLHAQLPLGLRKPEGEGGADDGGRADGGGLGVVGRQQGNDPQPRAKIVPLCSLASNSSRL